MSRIAAGDGALPSAGANLRVDTSYLKAQTSKSSPVRPSLIIPPHATILMAVHDFEARSPDELTLHKGDHIELIERDEEFSDGWYLGRSIATNEQGLFPQVYTAPAPKPTIPQPNKMQPSVAITPQSAKTASATEEDINSPSTAKTTPVVSQPPKDSERDSRSSTPDSHITVQTQSTGGITAVKHKQAHTPPLTFEKGRSTPTLKNRSSFGGGGVAEQSYVQGLRSPDIENTLSDIEEALSEISKNRQHRASKAIRDQNRGTHSAAMSSTDAGGDAHHNYHNHHSNHLPVPIELNDSSSEYSIQEPSHDVFSSDPSDDDDEDDDEDAKSDISMSEYSGLDEIPFTRADVMKWSPSEVSSYFKSRQMSPGICAKFEEQEVSGAILLELEMSHLKELELGSFGKRFEVWKEIEHLVKNLKQYSAPSKPRSGSDAASRQTSMNFLRDSHRQRSSTVGPGGVLPRIHSQHARPASRQQMITFQETNSPLSSGSGSSSLKYSSSTMSPPTSPQRNGLWEQPRSPPMSPPRGSPTKRLSMGDHSSAATALNAALSAGVAVLHAGGNEKHSRVSSFDKNWASSVIAGLHRPSTPSNKEKGKHKATPSAGTANTTDTGDSGFSGSINSPEKSYFSGGESSPQERKVLHKKGAKQRASYTEEQRLKSSTVHSRHSRISSAGEAVRRTSSTTLSAMQAYHDKSKHKRKSASFSGEPSILFNSPSSPISTTLSSEGTIGTKSLDKSDDGLGLLQSPTDPASPPPSAPQVGTASTGFFGAPISRSISPQSFINIPFGNRSISEAMRRTPKPEKNAVTKSTTPTKSEDVPTPTSPVARSISTAGTGRTSSSSADPPATAATTVTHQDPPLRPPKANRSKNKDSTKTQTRQRIRSISSGSGLRQKSKKQTTAWEKGLREITPADAAKDADFSGWMKKRGSSGVGAWKQRFFVLEGRRLSYFYSMDDTKERGVIDITSHKVLPATEDRLVGLHAAWAAATTPGSRIVSSPLPVTSATGSPSTPASADLDPESPCEAPSVPSADAKADPKATKVKKEHGWFTFKLLPPAPGAAKGVTFTPPRTHYFATDTKQQGKTWMASLMKATIDRDETKPVVMSYAAKTISLRRAREMRARPPGLGIDGLPQVPMHEGEGEESSSDEEGEVSDEEDQGVSIRIEIQQQPRTASLEGKIREIMSDGEEQQENQEMDNLGDMDMGPAGFDIDHSMFERPKSVLPKGKGEQQGLKMAVGIVG